MFNKIKVWWRWEGKYLHRDIKQGIRNLFKWFPIVWRDRDWDTHYIWEVMKFKLENQSKYIGGHDRHVSAKRDSEIMMTCVRLIEKIQSEYYQSEPTDYHKSKYHWDDCEDIPEHKQLRIEQIEENFDDYFAKYPIIYKKVINAEKMPFRRDEKHGVAINIGHINHKRAVELLFKIMKNNIESWWD